jgi:hypothetical protein
MRPWGLRLIVISDEVFERLNAPASTAPASFAVKGKADPLSTHVITTGR